MEKIKLLGFRSSVFRAGTILFLLPFLATACSSKYPKVQGITTDQIITPGQVTIVAPQTEPTLERNMLEGHAAGALSVATVATIGPVVETGQVWWLLLAPVTIPAGAIYGALASDSADEVRDNLAPIITYVEKTPFQELFREKFSGILKTNKPIKVIESEFDLNLFEIINLIV